MRGSLPICTIVLALANFAFADDMKAMREFSANVRPFLENHCFDCHGELEQQARLRFDQLSMVGAKERHLWTLIHDQISQGTMPPKKAAQPDEAERQAFLRWIKQQQRNLKTSGTRRLNRREFSAALCDVTGLNIDFRQTLPGDGRIEGFDTGAEALQDAADSIVQIVKTTRLAVEVLRFLEPAREVVFRADLRNEKDPRKAFDVWKKQGVSVSTGDTASLPGTGLVLKPKWVGERGGLRFRIRPPDPRYGLLRIQIEISVKKFRNDLPDSKLWVVVGGRHIADLDMTHSAENPSKLVFHIPLNTVAAGSKGVEITLSNRVEVPYEVKGFQNEDKAKLGDSLPGGPGLFRPVFEKKGPIELQPVPYLVLHSIEIHPDYHALWPPEDWKIEAEKIGDNLQSAEALLHIWMERAWRRPVSDEEKERFLKLYQKLRSQNFSFDKALRSTFQSVLMSGSFRYLPAPADVESSWKHYAIASRLSFLLWGTPPDQKLRDHAKAGQLSNPSTLDAEVDRLLADPRSEGFVRPFVTQWLEMDQPITIAMDHIQKQDFRFGRNLKASMKKETIAYVAQVLKENLSARELLSSNWTMMNEILARHYGYKNIKGGRLRKIQLRQDDLRGGGILSHAGIQSMLCWMGENWVIYRGAWTLRNLLDDPLPPPPLDVPELLPSDSANKGKTFKELLKQHQKDSRCAVCHKAMDPLGFAFQNFDLSGRWRKVEYEHYSMKELDGKIEWKGNGKTRPVDTIGHLPRGEPFQSFAECKQLLVEHYTEDFVLGLMKNLVIYATGRRADIESLREIREIISLSRSKNYLLRDLVKSVVRSKAFLER